MRRYDLVIWDWNGTLLDDVAANMEAIDTLLAVRGLPLLKSKESYLDRFRFPIVDYYGELGFDVAPDSFRLIAEEYVRVYGELAGKIDVFTGTREVLAALSEAGVRQAIVSAAETVRLRGEVSERGIEGYFTDILGTSDNRGDGKVTVGLSFIEACGVPRDRILFVGDMKHDADVASACGCDVIAVAMGHMSKKRLVEAGIRTVDCITDVTDAVLG